MPRELGLRKYWDHSKIEEGTKLVAKGKYLGTVKGQYGDQHLFRQIGDHQEIVLSGGTLNWRAENDYLNEGEVYDVYHAGVTPMEKGAFAGKDAKNFKIEVYDAAELGIDPVSVDAASEGDVEVPVVNGAEEPLNDLV